MICSTPDVVIRELTPEDEFIVLACAWYAFVVSQKHLPAAGTHMSRFFKFTRFTPAMRLLQAMAFGTSCPTRTGKPIHGVTMEFLTATQVCEGAASWTSFEPLEPFLLCIPSQDICDFVKPRLVTGTAHGSRKPLLCNLWSLPYGICSCTLWKAGVLFVFTPPKESDGKAWSLWGGS